MTFDADGFVVKGSHSAREVLLDWSLVAGKFGPMRECEKGARHLAKYERKPATVEWRVSSCHGMLMSGCVASMADLMTASYSESSSRSSRE